MPSVDLRLSQRVAVSVLLLSACSSGSGHATPTPTPITVVRAPETYRFHSVTESIEDEVSTVDGIADRQHHRYALHFRSSLGRASGGNMVISDGRWFAEISDGVWCANPARAQLIDRTNDDLAHPSIDPIEWWSRLRDGE